MAYIVFNLISAYTLIVFADSWAQMLDPHRAHPVSRILYRLTIPFLRPIRKFSPLIGRFDGSHFVLVAFLLILLSLSRRIPF